MRATLCYLAIFGLLVATSGCVEDSDAALGDIFITISSVICFLYSAIKSLIGPIAVFIIIWAGLKWTGSRDNPQDRTEAKKMIEAVIVGLVIIIAAMAIVSTIINDAGYTCGKQLTPKKV
jgi:hypothetical protein